MWRIHIYCCCCYKCFIEWVLSSVVNLMATDYSPTAPSENSIKYQLERTESCTLLNCIFWCFAIYALNRYWLSMEIHSEYFGCFLHSFLLFKYPISITVRFTSSSQSSHSSSQLSVDRINFSESEIQFWTLYDYPRLGGDQCRPITAKEAQPNEYRCGNLQLSCKTDQVWNDMTAIGAVGHTMNSWLR